MYFPVSLEKDIRSSVPHPGGGVSSSTSTAGAGLSGSASMDDGDGRWRSWMSITSHEILLTKPSNSRQVSIEKTYLPRQLAAINQFKNLYKGLVNQLFGLSISAFEASLSTKNITSPDLNLDLISTVTSIQ
jgi:hypothetical protein